MLALIVSALGCRAGAEAPVDEARDHVQAQMKDHHADAAAMRDAVVAGDLKAVKAAMSRLQARLPMQDLPAGTATSERSFVDRLRKVDAARDTTAAGEAVGELVGTCAACHAKVGVKPDIEATPEPGRSDGSLQASMAVHGYAALEMWAGLVIPDPARVRAGAEALSSAVLTPTGTQVGSPVSPVATELEVRVHDLAAHAARTDDEASRASAYGKMLGACAACHAVTGGGTAPRQ